MKRFLKEWGFSILRFVPLVICAIFMGLYLFSGEDITVNSLLTFAPESPINAAFFMIFLYAFKSFTIFFPIMVLNILGGFLFDPAHALLINALGILLELTISYCIGKASGGKFVNSFRKKHPRIMGLVDEKSGNQFFLSFFLRTVFCLPCDAVSMYFGAVKMPFHKYIIGSFLGSLPGTVLSTLLGMSITAPTSPMFWIAFALKIGFSLVTFICFRLWRNRKKIIHT